MTRVALYARYSDDKQSRASIEDQFRICRERTEREGWRVAETYQDAAISGATVTLRPGVLALLKDAQAGRFEVLMAEALDRISRDQADVAILYKHMQFSGVRIVTYAEGEINELHVGLKGTMNALYLKDLAQKTHRGIRGRVEAGKIGCGNAYGYRVVKGLDERGEPIRGEREIIPEQAEVVRRIFREYVAGRGAQSIAAGLNRDGIPSPTGGRWSDATIRGNRVIGSGILNCELYVGVIRWNRQRKLKVPDTGRTVHRLNPESEWIRAEAPALRIVDDETWRAAKAQQDVMSARYKHAADASRAQALNATHRPRTLLSGLLVCGCCGGSYAKRGQGRYACSNHILKAGCDNGRTVSRDALEQRVLAGLKDRLMAPEVAAEAMHAYAEETNRLNRERSAFMDTDRRALAETEKAIREIVRVVEQGGAHRALLDRLTELETRQDELTVRLSQAPADAPVIHPNIANLYRRKVERLSEALGHPGDASEAAMALRELIDRIVISPGEKRGEVHAVLHGDLEVILDWAARTQENANQAAPSLRMSVPVKARACPEDP